MSKGIMIRPACNQDRDFVGSMAVALLEFGSPVWDNNGDLAPGFADALAQRVDNQSPHAVMLIAQSVDERRLGFISLVTRNDVTGAERGHVADLAVVPDARRMGVGHALMAAGEAWTRQRGLSILSLDVWSTNERALAFYRRHGYRPESLCLTKAID